MGVATSESMRVGDFWVKVAPRFELGNGSFAGSCLTTWLYHRKRCSIAGVEGGSQGGLDEQKDFIISVRSRETKEEERLLSLHRHYLQYRQC